MDGLTSRAREFALEAHGRQQRRYEKTPYIDHLDRVAALLRHHGYDSPTVISAAYLHDVVEDTAYRMEDILDEFGPDVARLVYWLTDAEKGTRKIRKMMSAWRLGRAPFDAKLIKLADLADNTPSIVAHDPGFARVYLKEKAAILEEMAANEGEKLTACALFKLAQTNTFAPSENRASQ